MDLAIPIILAASSIPTDSGRTWACEGELPDGWAEMMNGVVMAKVLPGDRVVTFKRGATINQVPHRCQHWLSVGCAYGNIGSHRDGARHMVVRKKTETIHLRVSGTAKASLEGLATGSGKTATRILEDLIAKEAALTPVAECDGGVGSLFNLGEYSLLVAINEILKFDDPILKMLRAEFFAAEILNKKDRVIVRTILRSAELFSGGDDIFPDHKHVLDEEVYLRFPRLNLKTVAQHMSTLESFADFRIKNEQLNIDYQSYMKMTSSGD